MAIYKNGKKIAGSLKSISKDGPGNALTDLEVREDGAILGATLGNTFVDVGSEQTITGDKTFSGKILASGTPTIGTSESPFGNAYINNLYAISYLYTNGKKSINDGKVGFAVGAGDMHLVHSTNPVINFYDNAGTTVTNSIRSMSYGLTISRRLYTGGKTASADGITGNVLGDGNLHLISETEPTIYFYNENSNTTTNILTSNTNGLYMNGTRLATVNDITTETDLLQERIVEIESELKELKNQLSN